MLTYVREAVSFTQGRSRADLDRDTMLALALERAASHTKPGCWPRSSRPPTR